MWNQISLLNVSLVFFIFFVICGIWSLYFHFRVWRPFVRNYESRNLDFEIANAISIQALADFLKDLSRYWVVFREDFYKIIYKRGKGLVRDSGILTSLSMWPHTAVMEAASLLKQQKLYDQNFPLREAKYQVRKFLRGKELERPRLKYVDFIWKFSGLASLVCLGLYLAQDLF